MDWTALFLSLRLAFLTVLLLLPIGIFAGRALAYRRFRGKGLVEAIVALPLVLPPTVLGYYLLVAFGAASPVGQLWQVLFGGQLVFTFEGLLIASVIFNLPLPFSRCSVASRRSRPMCARRQPAAGYRRCGRWERSSYRSPGPVF